MQKKILSLCIVFAGTLFISTYGQSQFSGWLADFNTIKTGKKTSIHSDFQFRSSADIKHLQTTLLRSGLNYHLNKKLTITAGYAYISNRRTINGQAGYVPEHRLWEQLILSYKIKKLNVAHRFRVEQRFIGNPVVNGNAQSGNNFYVNRFRYFIRNILPLQKQTEFTRGFFAALQNEVFLNVGNSSKVNGKVFDQNRFYIATGYRLHSKADLEIGYMNQYVNGKGNAFTNNHVLQLAMYFKL
ncbi:MAG TPA: DUF2490 domain-containing protein [Chitinophagaceae bacterium]|nr:DUF2490 domain-containing protein [Chitinophagaceae bacterium]